MTSAFSAGSMSGGKTCPGADAEVGPHHEHAQLVGHVVEHGGRIVAVVLDDADVGVGQVDELPRQPLALVHVGHGVVAPGHEPRAVEQQPVALGPDLAEAEAGHLGVHGGSRRRPRAGLVQDRSPGSRGRARRTAGGPRSRGPSTGLTRSRAEPPPAPPRRRNPATPTRSRPRAGPAAEPGPRRPRLPGVAHRKVGGERALAHRGGHVHVLDPHPGLQAQVDVRLQADGGGARAPEAGVEGGLRVLAEGGLPWDGRKGRCSCG